MQHDVIKYTTRESGTLKIHHIFFLLPPHLLRRLLSFHLSFPSYSSLYSILRLFFFFSQRNFTSGPLSPSVPAFLQFCCSERAPPARMPSNIASKSSEPEGFLETHGREKRGLKDCCNFGIYNMWTIPGFLSLSLSLSLFFVIILCSYFFLFLLVSRTFFFRE